MTFDRLTHGALLDPEFGEQRCHDVIADKREQKVAGFDLRATVIERASRCHHQQLPPS